MAANAKQLVKVVKPNQTVHFIPLSALAQVRAQSNLLPADKKWTISVVNAAEAKNHAYKDTGHVSGPAAAVVAEKDKEIAALRAQLKKASEKGTEKTETPGGAAAPKSSDEKADMAIVAINALTTEAEINAYVEGEQRISVTKAAAARIEAITV
jgi:hypothetical protein